MMEVDAASAGDWDCSSGPRQSKQRDRHGVSGRKADDANGDDTDESREALASSYLSRRPIAGNSKGTGRGAQALAWSFAQLTIRCLS